MPGDGAGDVAGDDVRLREQGDRGECREDGEDDQVAQDGARDHRLKSANRSPVGTRNPEPSTGSCTVASGSRAVVLGA